MKNGRWIFSRYRICGRTEVLRVLYEAVHHGRLQLEAFLCVGVHFVRPVSRVEEVGGQHDSQVIAVHLVLGAPGISQK